MIDDANLSRAWSRLVLHLLDRAGTEVSPLVLSITGFDDNGMPREDSAVRRALDQLLEQKGCLSVDDVAFTIFPQQVWQLSQGDRARLFELYLQTFPRWQAINKRANNRGMYFQRLIRYGRGPCDGNQLEWILSQHASRHGVRRSMLQATTFDPARDHVASAQLGFPCLQQVSFAPTAGGLAANAFYATQQVFDKAYGNYLGLAQLAAFMANQMNLPLVRLTVMVGIAKLERITKSDPALQSLATVARSVVSNSDGASAPASQRRSECRAAS
ncbi:thymidylate synthase [Candidatus Palauibacter sp.]|uniref:thymidylate synthase n=1 Tax=Candidatus Palauibacter sp. TaxID=3101350 RepID=UPI003D0A55E7